MTSINVQKMHELLNFINDDKAVRQLAEKNRVSEEWTRRLAEDRLSYYMKKYKEEL